MSGFYLKRWLGFIDSDSIEKEELPHNMSSLSMSVFEDFTLY